MGQVLVVDDEDVLLEMIVALVDDLGYKSLVATNGDEALHVLHDQSEPPALIISDVMMPKMNGVELLESLQSSSQYNHIPFILMSAAGRPSNAHGESFFLQKPFSIDTLIELIDRYAGGKQVRQSGSCSG